MNAADRALLDHVIFSIRAGKTSITIPVALLEHASRDAMQAVRDLCRINNVEVAIRAG